MQISDLMNTYQNMLSSGTPQAPEGTKGVEQLVSALSKLRPGQIFEGTVNFVKGEQVVLGLSSGQNITAHLDNKSLSLMQGESVFFEVKNNDGKTINIKPVSIGGEKGNPAISGALSAAGLPQTETTMKMVDDMMKNKMSIDQHSLQTMARELAMHPGAQVSDVVTLKQLGIPVTDEMLTQLHNYKENEGALLSGMNDLAGAIDSAIAEGGETLAEVNEFMGAVTEILYPGEKFTSEQSMKDAAPAQDVLRDPEVAIKEALDAAAGYRSEIGQAAERASDGVFGAKAALESEPHEQLTRADYPRGTLGNAMEKEALDQLSHALGKDPEFKEKYPSLFNEKGRLSPEADIKDVLLAVRDYTAHDKSGTKLKSLLPGGEMKELLSAAFADKYTLEPKDIKEKGKIDDLYRKIEQDMQRLAGNAKEHPAIASTVASAAAQVEENLDFIHQVNQMYTYVQIPLKLSGQNATGDLYIYKNKKNKAEDSDEVSAFLHFDMEHLGSTDIAVKMKGKAVDTQFFMEDDVSYELIQNNLGLLEKKLTDLGYNCSLHVENEGHTVNFVEDFLAQDAAKAPASSMQRYSFDVRA